MLEAFLDIPLKTPISKTNPGEKTYISRCIDIMNTGGSVSKEQVEQVLGKEISKKKSKRNYKPITFNRM